MRSRVTARSLLFALVVLCSIQAQAEATKPRIGFLSASTREGAAILQQVAGFRQGLQDHGYVEGSNVTIDYRFADQQFDRLPGLVRELIRLKVDVLVTFVTQASVAAKDSTKTIPIVIVGVADPVGAGLVSSQGCTQNLAASSVTGPAFMSFIVAQRGMLPRSSKARSQATFRSSSQRSSSS
jgi:putative ABC transport system substrate-binding protein